MKKSKLTIVLIILALVGAGAYLYHTKGPAGAGILRLNVGNDFIIMLPSNRTTGYQWQIDRPLDGNMIKQKGFKYVPDDTGRVGSGGKEEWRFEAIGHGRSIVSFKYVRPWEKDVKPADTRVFTVVAKKGS